MLAIPERLWDVSCGDAIKIDYFYLLLFLNVLPSNFLKRLTMNSTDFPLLTDLRVLAIPSKEGLSDGSSAQHCFIRVMMPGWTLSESSCGSWGRQNGGLSPLILSTIAVHRFRYWQTLTPPLQYKWKKAFGETQTLRAGCSKADPIIFAPPQTPFPGGAGRPKFNQLEMVTFTYKPSLMRIDACNFELSW